MIFEQMIKEKIDDLSAGQKKVGSYILSNIEESSYGTLAKISREAGVSETTVIRFAYTLGYDSFSAMQNALRKELLGSNFREEVQEDEDNFCAQILNREIAILERTKRGLDAKQMEEAANRVFRADKVFSAAGRTVYPAALWFAEILNKYRGGVFAVRPEGSEFFDRMLMVDSNSVVVAVSFSRYTKTTIKFVRMAKERGAYIIVITDDHLNVLAGLGDVVFVTESNKDEAGINTISSATAVLNVLAASVRHIDSKKASQRLKDLEGLYHKMEDVLYE